MYKVYSRWDDKLIKTKPHLWLVQIHFFIPAALFLLLLSILYAFCAPLKYGSSLSLLISIVLNLILWVRVIVHQLKYSSNSFGFKQFYIIFLVNVLYFAVSLFIIYFVPYVFASRISVNFEQNNFSSLQSELWLSMIKTDYIRYLKQNGSGLQLKAAPTDNSDSSRYYRMLENQIKDNKFIFEDPDEHNTYFTVDSVANTLASDSASTVEDEGFPADSIIMGKFDPKLYSNLYFIRQRPVADIYKIKDSINNIIKRHGLEIYKGDSLSQALIEKDVQYAGGAYKEIVFSSSSINEYYDKITAQVKSLETSKTLKSTLDSVIPIIFFSGVALCHLVLAFTLKLSFKRTVVKRRTGRSKLVLFLWGVLYFVLTLLYLAGGEELKTVLMTWIENAYEHSNFYVFTFIVLLFLSWYVFALIRQRTVYSNWQYIMFTASYIYFPFVLAFLVGLIMRKNANEDYFQIAVFTSLISSFILLVLNYFLIPKCHFLANMPE